MILMSEWNYRSKRCDYELHKMTYQEQLFYKQKVIIKDVSQNKRTKPKGF